MIVWYFYLGWSYKFIVLLVGGFDKIEEPMMYDSHLLIGVFS